ncbi:MAG: aspartate kinase [Planctomycetes bacterium]|nr:aspartate kinase [Planctomycetota bacterium]
MTLLPRPAPRPVHKFGGASLTDGPAARRVGELLNARVADCPVAVVSAVEGVTSALDRVAHAAAEGRDELGPVRVRHRSLLAQLELDPEMLNRHFAELATILGAIRSRGALAAHERDHVLSFGERASARIVAAHLNARGLRAVPIDAYDLGLQSDSNHGRAKVLSQSAERVRSALARFDGIPVITGFLAADAHGRLTTLGRNGSDLSATLIGEAIGAREVCFWKEVGGVMTADPKLVPNARTLRALSYEEAGELTRHGAGVLHAESVQPLARSGIPGRVLCVRNPVDAGTLVSSTGSGAEAVGIACRRSVLLVRIAPESAETRAQVHGALARLALEPLHIASAAGELLVVTSSSEELPRELVGLGARVTIERELASVATVGSESPVLDAALHAAGVDVRARWRAGPPATRVHLLPAAQLALAARALHAAAFEIAVPPEPAR